MYISLMAGIKKILYSIQSSSQIFFPVLDNSFCAPVEEQLLFLYGINMQAASTLTITWKWQVVVQLCSFLLA